MSLVLVVELEPGHRLLEGLPLGTLKVEQRAVGIEQDDVESCSA